VKAKYQASAWTRLLILVCLSLLTASTALGQESEPLVVDEVIAQVNGEVITLSMVKREMKEAIEALKSQGSSEQQATAEITRRQPELIASLINEQLLVQKGKDIGLAEEVEAEVNKRMLQVANEQGIKTIESLDEAMKQSGMDPATIRQRLRAEIMKEMVMSREVDAKIYFGLSDAELQQYYKAHLDKFRKPEVVTLSEIWLPMAGKNEADVRAKALQLVSQVRAGADFGALAAANSEREQNGQRVAEQTKGKVGMFQVPDLRPDLAAAIKDVKAGGVTDPIRSNEGYQILRVDERTIGSDTPTYNENKVREMILFERREKERVAYLTNLRKDAYIKIAESYRAAIEPLLGPAAPKTTTTTPPAASNSSNKGTQKGNKQK
jgi:peptidyl-prolyl cis-trans isomerase SurA